MDIKKSRKTIEPIGSGETDTKPAAVSQPINIKQGPTTADVPETDGEATVADAAPQAKPATGSPAKAASATPQEPSAEPASGPAVIAPQTSTPNSDVPPEQAPAAPKATEKTAPSEDTESSVNQEATVTPPTAPVSSHAPGSLYHPEGSVQAPAAPDETDTETAESGQSVYSSKFSPAGGGAAKPPAAATAVTPPPKGRRKLLLILVISLVAVLLLAGTAYAYMYVVAPKQALRTYAENLGGHDTAAYSLFVSSEQSGESGNFKAEITMDGQLDGSDEENPKLTSDIKFLTEASGVSNEITGELRLVDDTMYVKPGTLGVLGAFLGDLSGQWIRFDIDDLDEATGAPLPGGGDAEAPTCDEEQFRQLFERFAEQLEQNQIVPEDTRRVGLFETVDDRRTQHYAGTITVQQQRDAFQRLKDQDADGCLGDAETDAESELSDISYDVWLGSGFDRLELRTTADDTDTTVRLTTQDYGQAVEVVAPTESKTFEELMGEFGGMFEETAPGAVESPEGVGGANTPIFR